MSDGRKKPSSSSSFHFVVGLGSGLTSAVLLQPADLLKTRVQQSRSSSLLQTIKTISRQPQPLRQLWRGTLPSTIRTSVGSALYFTSLNALRQHFAKPSGNTPTTAQSSALPKLSGTANMATGAFARASVGFLMMPITVIKVRFESDLYAYRSLASASRDILASQGLRGFFAGFGATALRDAPYAGLYVLFYEQSKAYLSSLTPAAAASLAPLAPRASGPAQPTASMGGGTAASVNFVSGMLAAGLATALTNPPDAVKTRLQLRPEKYRNMVQAARLMLAEEGVRSLFDGLALRVARKGLSSALAWTVYEDVIRRAERRWGVEE